MSSASSPGPPDVAADVDAFRPVWAEIDLEAVRANVRAWRALVAPAAVCAVVKADGYGHGAVAVGRAAIEAGAGCLAVALVEEGVQLREAGIDAPVLVLSEPVPAAAEAVIAHRLTPVVYTATGIDANVLSLPAAGDLMPFRAGSAPTVLGQPGFRSSIRAPVLQVILPK